MNSIRHSAGFTIVELMVGITLTVILTIVLGELTVSGYRTYTAATEQVSQVATARRARDTIVRDIREAIISDAGDYAIIVAEANRLEIYSDSDRDVARERLRFWRDGRELKRGLTEPTGTPVRYNNEDETIRILANNLTGTASTFRYYGPDGAELSSPVDVTKVVSVGISLSVDVTINRSPEKITVETVVRLRNQ